LPKIAGIAKESKLEKQRLSAVGKNQTFTTEDTEEDHRDRTSSRVIAVIVKTR